ncbi:MAG: PQQ-binding-like beta-propeller repeat protein [Candidatus Solibacter sp.]|nr:PQQ-binding-like beta-propeller repeat protein [Candidatus Solibacter sp.]
MTLTQKGERNRAQRRLWPGVAAVLLLWFIRFGVPVAAPEAIGVAVMGEFAGGLAVLVWWVFLSRAPWVERLGAIVLMIAALVATRRILHESIATGMMGMMLVVYSIPVLSLALVAWAVASRRLGGGLRRATLAATILVACGFWALLRTDGITAEARSQFAWRWAKTSEQKLLDRAQAEAAARPVAPSKEAAGERPAPQSGGELSAVVRATLPAALPSPVAAERTRAEWSGFRGPHRDDRVTGVKIKTDWASSPPVELWRRPVGPGWSSFAVGDGLLYTQEQRGDFEVVACYKATTGEPVWTHRDAARFWESNAGAGPRATPTLRDGRIYAFGATGILNALDARNGAVVWTRNAASDTGTKIPIWGFTSSPLVVDDLVIVAATGRLAAYDRATGDPRWRGPDDGMSYSSPHWLTIDGVAQVLLLNDAGATSVAPADGSVLWKYSWPGFSILQPAVTADGGVLITTSSAAGGIGTRRLAVAHGPGRWTVEEVWTSSGLKPYFNDFVVQDGHAFGFDGGILACIDLQDGKRKWKGGRYGHGQLLLLTDQDLLLVLSEEGELALVAAVPGQFTEIARIPAMEGKTWNHPVLAGDILLVRNGREMVAFRLSLAGG